MGCRRRKLVELVFQHATFVGPAMGEFRPNGGKGVTQFLPACKQDGTLRFKTLGVAKEKQRSHGEFRLVYWCL